MQETQETRVPSLRQEDLLEKEMTTYSSILSWEIPWTEEPGGLSSMGPQSPTWLNDWQPQIFLEPLAHTMPPASNQNKVSLYPDFWVNKLGVSVSVLIHRMTRIIIKHIVFECVWLIYLQIIFAGIMHIFTYRRSFFSFSLMYLAILLKCKNLNNHNIASGINKFIEH